MYRPEWQAKNSPQMACLAVLINPANVRYTETTSKSLSESARTIGVNIVFFKASTPDAGTDEAGHAFQFEAGRVFRSEAGHPWRQSHGSI
jgi:hypothetical protein